MSEMLQNAKKEKSFLLQIITGDEKLLNFDNPKPKIMSDAKVVLCIWLDQKGELYYEVLKSAIIFYNDNARPHIPRPVKNDLVSSG